MPPPPRGIPERSAERGVCGPWASASMVKSRTVRTAARISAAVGVVVSVFTVTPRCPCRSAQVRVDVDGVGVIGVALAPSAVADVGPPGAEEDAGDGRARSDRQDDGRDAVQEPLLDLERLEPRLVPDPEDEPGLGVGGQVVVAGAV